VKLAHGPQFVSLDPTPAWQLIIMHSVALAALQPGAFKTIWPHSIPVVTLSKHIEDAVGSFGFRAAITVGSAPKAATTASSAGPNHSLRALCCQGSMGERLLDQKH